MTLNSLSYPEKVDISNCAKEPIHIIGKAQSHGVIISCDLRNLEIVQCSENTSEVFSIAPEQLLGQSLFKLIGQDQEENIRKDILDESSFLPKQITVKGKDFLMLPKLSEEHLLIDFEPLQESIDPIVFQTQLTGILNNLRSAGSVEDLCKEAAKLTKGIFNYHRVMVYRFDKDWNGEVVAEEKEEAAESWLGLRYPASDIPAQSRALFLKNQVRIITNVNDTPAPITPQVSPVNNKPLDLTKSGLRGVSPIHIEYLQNMGVGASLTAAIVVGGKLWGLITCHHNSAKYINYYQRESCRFLAQMFSNEIALRESEKFIEKTEASEKVREKLASQIKRSNNLFSALISETPFTDLVSCGGGALIYEEEIVLLGETPSEEEVKELIPFLSQQPKNLFYTTNLSEEFSKAKIYKEVASGILSARISENNYIIWFRPEVLQTVEWGGNPENKVSYNEEKQRLSPRKSFEKWSQQLSGISLDWETHDFNAVNALQENVRYFLLERQRNKIQKLNNKLIEANKEVELFSYGLSHDLRAPLRGIQGYLQIMKEDFEDKVGEQGKIFINSTLEYADKMNTLIDDILSYSQVSSGKIQKSEFSVNQMVDEILGSFNVKRNYPVTKIIVQKDMPPVIGDKRMLSQLWANLINNALIYSSKQENPQVEIGCVLKDHKNVYFVKDNGIGIAPEFQEKIFENFSRLEGKKFKGSGIGLAIVKLVIKKHEGKISVESELEKGATFYFEL